jgi:hypothetical protein
VPATKCTARGAPNMIRISARDGVFKCNNVEKKKKRIISKITVHGFRSIVMFSH